MLPEELEIGDILVTKKGEVIRITSDDMPNYPYESFERLATKAERQDLIYKETKSKIIDMFIAAGDCEEEFETRDIEVLVQQLEKYEEEIKLLNLEIDKISK